MSNSTDAEGDLRTHSSLLQNQVRLKRTEVICSRITRKVLFLACLGTS